MTVVEVPMEPCGCEVPGPFYSGVPGILAAMADGRVAPGAVVERCDACRRFASDTAALARLVELGPADPKSAAQRKSFTVHCFPEVRVTFPGMVAADAKKAVERAIDRFCWETHRCMAEFTEGFNEFLVDVDGDHDYRRSRSFDEALEDAADRPALSRVWALVIHFEYERSIHVCTSKQRALKLLRKHVHDRWQATIGDLPIPVDAAEAIRRYFADAPDDFDLEEHVVAQSLANVRSTAMPTYECDKCGACCRGHLLVEAYQLDLLREPRLAQADCGRKHLPPVELMADLEQEGRCLLIAGGLDHPCPFLAGDDRCTIYPTRPNVCVAMQAGDEQCQSARDAAGLPPLEPAAS